MLNIEKAKAGDWPASGQWRLLFYNGTRTALVGCPGCGVRASLSGTHTVGLDGCVNPSLWCAECGFHDWVRLIDWEP